ncbi:hypothetical protein SSP35_40_00130 [Streptomyces sp. NBRC 110611]|uniref:hypothetical protein n=1 Tax=Streptomyces sp. NBRC 110611 TaxID=1621259 RepID=UPI00082B7A33|nr:hypothetical protein [Streptomyces sp. NBRC 110611]GAU71447.1 hypothetical protein SSP35_40_00130 [Streptomyces sp. NBRC 110611]
MTRSHSPSNRIVTLAVHPEGQTSLHREGRISVHATPEQAWLRLYADAVGLEGPVDVAVAGPDGRVVSWRLGPEGNQTMVNGFFPAPALSTDPAWSGGLPDRYNGLIAKIRAADRSNLWVAAQVTAGKLAAQVAADAGEKHPHTLLALALHATFTLRAGDWPTATRLCMDLAQRCHEHGAPAPRSATALRNAVGAWIRSPAMEETHQDGLELVHTVIRIAPGEARMIAAVLERLGSVAPL